MKMITFKHIFFGVTILAFLAFIALLIWKLGFNGDISSTALIVIGLLNVSSIFLCILIKNKLIKL